MLTSERVEKLHAAEFEDPGRTPNYSRRYRLDEYEDAAIAHELLAILRDANGYVGKPRLKVTTE